MSGPTAFQIEVARMFFRLTASDGFLLAGGGALLASGLTSRPTKDLDFFGEKGRADVNEVRVQLLKVVIEIWLPVRSLALLWAPVFLLLPITLLQLHHVVESLPLPVAGSRFISRKLSV